MGSTPTPTTNSLTIKNKKMATDKKGLKIIPGYVNLLNKITDTNINSLLQMYRVFERREMQNKEDGITDMKLTSAMQDLRSALNLLRRIKLD